jgi:hypothetical protein
MKSSTSSSGRHKSQLNYCNNYIKIGLVPAKPSCKTTFWTTLSICDEIDSILSSKDNALLGVVPVKMDQYI